MTQQRTFLRRLGHWVCVAPATLLCGDSLVNEDKTPLASLREDASRDGLCYLQLVRVVSDDLYLARVAPSPDELSPDALTAFLTEAQLRFAFPWDCRLQGKSPARILNLLCGHAAGLLPARQTPPPPIQETLFSEEEALVTLEPVVVSQACLASHFGPQGAAKMGNTNDARLVHVQQSLLLAVLHVLTSHMRHTSDTAHKTLLDARCTLIGRVRRWQKQTRQRVVNAVPFFDVQAQSLSWQLRLVVPSHLLSSGGLTLPVSAYASGG